MNIFDVLANLGGYFFTWAGVLVAILASAIIITVLTVVIALCVSKAKKKRLGDNKE